MSQVQGSINLFLSLFFLDLAKSMSRLDTSNIDPFDSVRSRPNVDSSIGKNTFDRVRSFNCRLELVRESQIHSFPHFISHGIVMLDLSCVNTK